MAYKFALAATLALSLLDPTSAQPRYNNFLEPRSHSGINCDGSIKCANFKGNFADMLAKVNAISIGKTFNSGDTLACSGNQMGPDGSSTYQNRGESSDGLCAMIGDNTPTYTVGASTNGQKNSAADVIEDLIYHGCKACGTAPTNRECSNNLSEGSIVVNDLEHVCYYTEANPCGS